MFAGGWLAWPWYVLNGFALGSPNLKRECALVAGGLVGAAVLIVVLFNIAGFIVGEDRIRETVPYVILGIVVWKLVIGYWLYSLQARTALSRGWPQRNQGNRLPPAKSRLAWNVPEGQKRLEQQSTNHNA